MKGIRLHYGKIRELFKTIQEVDVLKEQRDCLLINTFVPFKMQHVVADKEGQEQQRNKGQLDKIKYKEIEVKGRKGEVGVQNEHEARPLF